MKKYILTLLLLSLIVGMAVSSQSKISEETVADLNFTPIIQNEIIKKATTTKKNNFEIKTIKYFPEVASATPAKYDYTAITHTKIITQDEYNYCRSKKSEKECKEEIEQIIADSKKYHLEVEKERFKQLQLRLNQENYFNEL